MLPHILAILILPVTVLVVVPGWILVTFAARDSRWMPGSALPSLFQGFGVLIFVAGFMIFAWCIVLFARIGRGTLAPWDPTRRLVVVGPYRHVRNPMISGVVAMLGGEALLSGSLLIAGWLALFLLINHVYFLISEEPGLARRFGESYDEYRAAVPRWIPRLRPWPGGSGD
ncbi:MAG TPA: isoprenylcysteine carboxylmethyltransferase family protein [Gemmatimonadaceae bacterium]|nr:isoprenylcysteine carboxylmethyltransferase family protein [Gemmatimonadaceae bacterium]